MKAKENAYDDIEKKLKLKSKKPLYKRFLFWLVILAIAGGVGYRFYGPSNQQPTFTFKTAPAQKGDLTVTVSATGTLEPVNQVDIGVEISGTVQDVLVDYNDRVQKGDVLARLDPTKLEAQVLQSKASLQAAEASLAQAEADVFETQNALERQKRARQLSGGKTPSQSELVSAEAAFKRAQASTASAKAKIAEAKATLKLNDTDLSKAVIRSPISGMVLSRNVEPGSTVAASLSTPTLFTLAEDLTRMELNVSVDEADIGQVQEGQDATFTVDAYPDGNFRAKVTQVRFASTTVDDVVTYVTLLQVDNSDLKLRPGMTATAEITVQKASDALLAPNTALRFAPETPAGNGPPQRRRSGFLSMLMPRPPGQRSKPQEAEVPGGRKRVWILRDGRPVPVPVQVGLTDGIMTQILEGDISPGQPLITEMTGPAK